MKKLVILALCVLYTNTAFAHEFILKPVMVNKAGTFLLEVFSTHYFFKGEELEDAKYNSVYVLENGKKTELTLTADEKKLVYTASYDYEKPFADKPVIIVGHRAGMFYSTTTKGGQDGTRAELEAKGFTVLKTTLYEKFAKAFFNSDSADKTFITPVGHTLEFIPVTNPADIKKDQDAVFKVLYNGKPIEIEVKVAYDGFNAKDQEAYVLHTKSNAEGLVTITPTTNAFWMLQATLNLKSDKPECDALEYRATVMFDVK